MLRECRRVLVPGGYLGALTIETRPGLGRADLTLAAELGPTSVRAEAPLEELVVLAGLDVVEVADLTDEFAETIRVMTEQLRADEALLRREEGAIGYEDEVGKKQRMKDGIERGVLRRTLVVARRAP